MSLNAAFWRCVAYQVLTDISNSYASPLSRFKGRWPKLDRADVVARARRTAASGEYARVVPNALLPDIRKLPLVVVVVVRIHR